jgi:hypothetical protein
MRRFSGVFKQALAHETTEIRQSVGYAGGVFV